MKKNKGFTLIELLAVIIILAVIALIATPIVLNVVENARESARKSSINGYGDAIKLAIYEEQFKNGGTIPTVNKEWADSRVDMDGEEVVCEEVHYSNTFGVVLHKCSVGENKKQYCSVQGKVYDNCEEEQYKSIYDSIGNIVLEGKDLAEELKKQYNESNTVGLLKEEEGYYYKGSKEEVVNNFVWFGGHLWRVISIDKDNNLTMITQQPITAISPASEVWDSKEKYEASYVNDWLNNVFLTSLETNDRNKIQENIFNVGISNKISEITISQKAGLLNYDQYIKAGGQNSFLDLKNYFLTGNRYDNESISNIASNGALNYHTPNNAYGIRPVIKARNIRYTEGEGTLENPYRERSKTTNTSNIKVGEYLSIPTSGTDCGEDQRCLFRVVSKDNNSIKVTFNGLFPDKSSFSEEMDDITYTSGNAVDMVVTTFANTIDSKYRYSENDKTFGIGQYLFANYHVVQQLKYTGNAGLPVVGEMFSGNDIDISTSAEKKFVNGLVIENPPAAINFWLMNGRQTSMFMNLSISYEGMVGGNKSMPLAKYGVRPVLFLNHNLNFISGEGTAENPFTLE